jgi:hypothetical protein
MVSMLFAAKNFRKKTENIICHIKSLGVGTDWRRKQPKSGKSPALRQKLRLLEERKKFIK